MGAFPATRSYYGKRLLSIAFFLNNFDIRKNTNKKAYVSIVSGLLKKYDLLLSSKLFLHFQNHRQKRMSIVLWNYSKTLPKRRCI